MLAALERRKVIRILKFCVIGLLVLTIVLFVLSLYTVINGLVGAISGDTFKLELDKDNPRGDWILTFDGNPRNSGILGEKLAFSIGLLDPNDKYIAKNSTEVSISPGEKKPFSITLTLPYETVQKYNLNETQTADVTFELLFSIRSLGDLVGFQQTMRIGAGEGL